MMKYYDVAEGILNLDLRTADTLVLEVSKMSTDCHRVVEALLLDGSLCLNKIDLVENHDVEEDSYRIYKK